MAEQDVATLDPTSEGKSAKRERSTIQFPYVDLDNAVDVAKKMHGKNGSAPCGLDQLAAWLDHDSVASGTFRNKVAAARHFGLVSATRNQVTLTALGMDINEPPKEKSSRAKAFLTVPLYKKLFETYRGRALPPDVGLENEMKSMGVAPKQADKARQTMKRSADQAGFLAQGKNRLVLPSNVSLESGSATAKDGGDRDVKRGGNGGTPPTGIHPKIRMLLNLLPPEGDIWPVEDQEVWLDLVRGVFGDLFLPEPEPEDTI